MKEAVTLSFEDLPETLKTSFSRFSKQAYHFYQECLSRHLELLQDYSARKIPGEFVKARETFKQTSSKGQFVSSSLRISRAEELEDVNSKRLEVQAAVYVYGRYARNLESVTENRLQQLGHIDECRNPEMEVIYNEICQVFLQHQASTSSDLQIILHVLEELQSDDDLIEKYKPLSAVATTWSKLKTQATTACGHWHNRSGIARLEERTKKRSLQCSLHSNTRESQTVVQSSDGGVTRMRDHTSNVESKELPSTVFRGPESDALSTGIRSKGGDTDIESGRMILTSHSRRGSESEKPTASTSFSGGSI